MGKNKQVPEPEFSINKDLSQLTLKVDRLSKDACIEFLRKEHPTTSQYQAAELVELIFEPNLKAKLPNHFGRQGRFDVYGCPWVWLLNELETGGIQYLYKNNIWQIHWDSGARFLGEVTWRKENIAKYLVTMGPGCKEELWKNQKLLFFTYCGSTEWEKYQIKEGVDLSFESLYLQGLAVPSQ